MTRMNEKPLDLKRNFSFFFYQNKLYDFSQKKLSEQERLEMLKWIERSPVAKHEIGSVLMALEYLEKLSQVELNLSEKLLREEVKKAQLKNKLSHILVFVTLFIVFFVSGYYCLEVFILGNSVW